MMIEELIEKLKAATGPDANLDEALNQYFLMIEGYPTASIDAALILFKAIFPDGPDQHYSMTIWTGRNPAARLMYHQRDADAEGGWGIGWLNHPFEVRARTEPLAICLAVLEAIHSRDAA
ncbi:hypothetical protein GOC14_07050 [Sinorhizobium meliloti]|nr:hypothetical protein [Sinorhizobium meliloti]